MRAPFPSDEKRKLVERPSPPSRQVQYVLANLEVINTVFIAIASERELVRAVTADHVLFTVCVIEDVITVQTAYVHAIVGLKVIVEFTAKQTLYRRHGVTPRDTGAIASIVHIDGQAGFTVLIGQNIFAGAAMVRISAAACKKHTVVKTAVHQIIAKTVRNGVIAIQCLNLTAFGIRRILGSDERSDNQKTLGGV